MADADRDSDIGDDSPVSARSEGETSGEHSYESSDEGVARDSRPHHQLQEQTHQALSLTPLQTHTINHHTVVNHQLNNHQQLNNLQMNHQAVNNHQLLNNHQLNHHLRRNSSRPLDRDSNMSRGSLTTNGGSTVTIRDDFESLKSSIHPHLSSLASLAQGPVPGPSAVFGVASSSASGGFQYATPAFLAPAPPPPPQPTGSNSSSTSSEGSAAGWSFEEQYKQVRQLYELSDDPGRKEFLDDLFAFMQKEGSPINRLPIMAKSVLDLYELYRLVIARGGLVEVINKKLWQEIIKGLNLPSSITSAAFTLRTQYMKFLYRYECEKNKLSTTKELEVAIESNKREGRRSSGQYEAQAQAQAQAQVQAQVQAQALAMQQQNGRGIPSPLSQLPPQMQSLALAMASSVPGMPGMPVMPGMPGLPRLPLPPLPAIPTHPHVSPQEMEYRVREYLRLLQQNSASNHGAESSQEGSGDLNGHSGLLSPGAAAMNALEVQRMALWSLYNNNTSQPDLEPQREALNLSDSPHSGCTKREASSPLPQAKRRAIRPDSPQPSLHSTSPHRQMSSPPRPLSTRSSPAGPAARHSSRDLSPPGPTGLRQARSSSSPGPSGLRQARVLSSPGPAGLSHPMVNGHSPVSRPAAFKLTTRGDPSTGDQQLDVSIEINGVTYAGVLFPSSQSSEEDQDRRHLIS